VYFVFIQKIYNYNGVFFFYVKIISSILLLALLGAWSSPEESLHIFSYTTAAFINAINNT